MTDPSKTHKISSESKDDPTASVVRRIRVRSADSAYVYAVFEASEGVCGYSTLPHRPGDRHRDLELVIPVGQVPEADRILAVLQSELAGEIHVIEEFAASSSRSFAAPR